MDSEVEDNLITRLVGAAVDDTQSSEKAALIERLFAALPAESQERLLRDVLDQLGPRNEPSAPSAQAPRSHGTRIPLMWEPGGSLPVRNIGPWQMCCRMMSSVDQAASVDEFDPGLPAEVFAALGDETRIRIIRLLQDSERRLEDIARTLSVPQSTLSHHLRVLRTAGLIRVDKRGRSSFYSLAQPQE
jgi:biotin operon repressor